MDNKETKNENDWHLQVAYGTWVLWGYEGFPANHIDAAKTTINIAGLEHVFEFSLPISPTMPPTYEERRVTCWAWRFSTNNLVHTCSWNLADSVEQCLQDAQKYADEALQRSIRSTLHLGLNDVRKLDFYKD